MKIPHAKAPNLLGVQVCFFLSGVAGLIYQVAWTKALAVLFGYTAYAVATVLAVFMGGLAFGSAWLGKWAERYSNSIALYGWVELGVALTGGLSLAGLAFVRLAYFAFYPAASGSQALLLGVRLFGAGVVLFVPTFLMGGTLPILIRGVTLNAAELGARVSRFYAANTLGAVAGTALDALPGRRTVGQVADEPIRAVPIGLGHVDDPAKRVLDAMAVGAVWGAGWCDRPRFRLL